jgi:hypothetical protein
MPGVERRSTSSLATCGLDGRCCPSPMSAAAGAPRPRSHGLRRPTRWAANRSTYLELSNCGRPSVMVFTYRRTEATRRVTVARRPSGEPAATGGDPRARWRVHTGRLGPSWRAVGTLGRASTRARPPSSRSHTYERLHPTRSSLVKSDSVLGASAVAGLTPAPEPVKSRS